MESFWVQAEMAEHSALSSISRYEAVSDVQNSLLLFGQHLRTRIGQERCRVIGKQQISIGCRIAAP